MLIVHNVLEAYLSILHWLTVYKHLHNMKTLNGRKLPIVKHEIDFRMLMHSLFITDLSLLFLHPAGRMILEDFMGTWLKKI